MISRVEHVETCRSSTRSTRSTWLNILLFLLFFVARIGIWRGQTLQKPKMINRVERVETCRSSTRSTCSTWLNILLFLLLWEQLSRANRVRFCPSAFRVVSLRQFIAAFPPASPVLKASQFCLPLIRSPQPSPRLHCIVRLQRCNLCGAVHCRTGAALIWDGTSWLL